MVGDEGLKEPVVVIRDPIKNAPHLGGLADRSAVADPGRPRARRRFAVSSDAALTAWIRTLVSRKRITLVQLVSLEIVGCAQSPATGTDGSQRLILKSAQAVESCVGNIAADESNEVRPNQRRDRCSNLRCRARVHVCIPHTVKSREVIRRLRPRWMASASREREPLSIQAPGERGEGDRAPPQFGSADRYSEGSLPSPRFATA